MASTDEDLQRLRDSIERFLWADPPDGPSTTVLDDTLAYLDAVLTLDRREEVLQHLRQDMELETHGLRYLRQ